MGVVADVTRYADLNALREKTESELGPVDIVAAFAGGQGMPVSVTELSLETWNQSLAINLTGVFLTLKGIPPRHDPSAPRKYHHLGIYRRTRDISGVSRLWRSKSRFIDAF